MLTAARTAAGPGPADGEVGGRAAIVLEDAGGDEITVHASFYPQLEDLGGGEVAATPAQATALELLDQLAGDGDGEGDARGAARRCAWAAPAQPQPALSGNATAISASSGVSEARASRWSLTSVEVDDRERGREDAEDAGSDEPGGRPLAALSPLRPSTGGCGEAHIARRGRLRRRSAADLPSASKSAW